MEPLVKPSLTKCIAFAAALVVVASGCGSDGAVDLGNANNRLPWPTYLPTHFPVLPPVGLKPSKPTTGKWLIDVSLGDNSEWTVFPDGRFFANTRAYTKEWGSKWVEQRLTRRGAQLLRSTILATGLFQHNLSLARRSHQKHDDNYKIWTPGRTISVDVTSPPDDGHPPKETRAQARALSRINALFTRPAKHLPAWAWADRTIQPWIAPRYIISHDRYAPNPSKLPPPANAALAQYTKFLNNYGQDISTKQARALLQAFTEAGIAPAINNAHEVFYDFAGLRMLPGGLILHPADPEDLVIP